MAREKKSEVVLNLEFMAPRSMDLYMANEVEDRGERFAQHRSIEKSPLNCKFKCRRRLRKRGAVTSPGGQKSKSWATVNIHRSHGEQFSFLQQFKKSQKKSKRKL